MCRLLKRKIPEVIIMNSHHNFVKQANDLALEVLQTQPKVTALIQSTESQNQCNNLSMLGSAAYVLNCQQSDPNSVNSATSNMDVLASASLQNHRFVHQDKQFDFNLKGVSPYTHSSLKHKAQIAKNANVDDTITAVYASEVESTNQLSNTYTCTGVNASTIASHFNMNDMGNLNSVKITNSQNYVTEKVNDCAPFQTLESRTDNVNNVLEKFRMLNYKEKSLFTEKLLNFLEEMELIQLTKIIAKRLYGTNNETCDSATLQSLVDTECSDLPNGSIDVTEKKSRHCMGCSCKNGNLRPYICRYCSKRFGKWRSLRLHLKKHTGEEIFPCWLCKHVSATKQELNSHVRKTHCDGENELYKCSICLKSFSSSTALKNHQVLHSGKKPFACQYCPKKFTQKTNLITHEKLHRDDLQYKCDKCEKRFVRKDYLTDHQEATHSVKKLFHCQFCNKEFAWKNALKKHEFQHMDTTVYKCNICNKEFKAQSNLRMHQRIHSGIKPHACMVCNKQFIQKQDLSRHMMTHTGIKPHVCTLCGKSFSRPSELKKHMNNAVHLQQHNT